MNNSLDPKVDKNGPPPSEAGGGCSTKRPSKGENSLKVESAAAEKSPEKTKPAKSPERKLSTSQGAGGSRKASTYSNCTDDDEELLSTTKAFCVSLEDNPNLMVYQKIEKVVERMQDEETGVPVKTVKSFMTKIPSVFTGQDMVTWMMANMDFSYISEALILANRIGSFGYFFPIDDHVLTVKNDNTYYRFQTPYYWPSRNWAPENTDYAVYLCKRTMQNKARLELADYEAENLARLQKMFSRKWETIFMQAEAQSKVDKKRDKLERKILDTQERAFWDVYRPPTGCVNATELDIKKVCKLRNNPNHEAEDDLKVAALMKLRLQTIAANLKTRIDKCTIKVSKCAETYVEYYQMLHEYDPFLVPSESNNPWTTDSTDFWEMFEKCTKDQVAEKRVRRWGFSCWDLLRDPVGHDHFKAFLEKEYATENLFFVEAVWRMKKLPQKDVAEECKRIWSKFLAHGEADMLVNVDSKSHKITELNMENPDRWTFDVAAAHLYYLMTSDSYSRYLRSSHYKEFLENAKKNKTSRSFNLPKKLNHIVSSHTGSGTVS